MVGAAGRAPRVRNPPQGVRGEGSGAGEEQEPPLRLAGGGLITRADQLGSRRGRETSRGRSGRWLSGEGGCAATGGCVCDVLPHVHSVTKCAPNGFSVCANAFVTQRGAFIIPAPRCREASLRGLVAACAGLMLSRRWPPRGQASVGAPAADASDCAEQPRQPSHHAESGKGEGGIRGVSEEPHRVVVSKSAAEG